MLPGLFILANQYAGICTTGVRCHNQRPISAKTLVVLCTASPAPSRAENTNKKHKPVTVLPLSATKLQQFSLAIYHKELCSCLFLRIHTPIRG
jgi:hypothetical protein